MLARILGAGALPRPQVEGGGGFWLVKPDATAGVPVTDQTARTFSAVWAAVKLISEDLAKLPWRHLDHAADRRRIISDDLDQVLHYQANPEMGAFQWREFMAACALLRGNGYSEIEFSRSGRVRALWPFMPHRVELKRAHDTNRLQYVFTHDDGRETALPPERVFHLRGPTRDGLVGWSVISLAAESWGLAMAAQKFGARFFANGAIPGLVIQEGEGAPKMTQEAVNNMLESFDRKHRGVGKAGKTAFLERGFSIDTVGISQKDAQFLQTRQHQIQEVARWFRVPLHKIAELERTTHNNIESQNIEYVVDCLQPWITRLEQEAQIKLVSGRNRATKVYVQGLLRGDTKARGEWYQTMRDLGAFSINKILELEDEDPIPGGDLRLVPMNMTTIERAAQGGSTDSAGVLRSQLVDVHQRMLKRQAAAAEKALKRDEDLSDWGEPFFEGLEAQMTEALLPAALVAAERIRVDGAIARELVARHVREHIEASIKDLAINEWEHWSARAGDETDMLLGRIAARATPGGS